MSVIAVSGEPGCPVEETARAVARLTGGSLWNDDRLSRRFAEAFGEGRAAAERHYATAAAYLLAQSSAREPIVAATRGMEFIGAHLTGSLRVHLTGSWRRRRATFLVEQRLEGEEAEQALRDAGAEYREWCKSTFGRVLVDRRPMDLVILCDCFSEERIARWIAEAAEAKAGLESARAVEEHSAQLHFDLGMELARRGVSVSPAAPGGRPFAHPSEAIFANLLDFYGIAWEYEPRSFPVEWDEAGRVREAFTPDFYLPEFNQYVELTTMKQSLVTRKNRKLKRIQALYPEVSVRIFYAKDVQDLIFKYGLAGSRITR